MTSAPLPAALRLPAEAIEGGFVVRDPWQTAVAIVAAGEESG